MTQIDIISGFLGAGKTTLIKKLLQEGFPKEKTVLIENEFGEIGIDGGFLKEAGVEIKEMNSRGYGVETQYGNEFRMHLLQSGRRLCGSLEKMRGTISAGSDYY